VQEAQGLFREGLLSEAALALEAELQRGGDRAEVWRLLGTVHAENDNDPAAISAMMRAHKVRKCVSVSARRTGACGCGRRGGTL
jgi:peroxin-5